MQIAPANGRIKSFPFAPAKSMRPACIRNASAEGRGSRKLRTHNTCLIIQFSRACSCVRYARVFMRTFSRLHQGGLIGYASVRALALTGCACSLTLTYARPYNRKACVCEPIHNVFVKRKRKRENSAPLTPSLFVRAFVLLMSIVAGRGVNRHAPAHTPAYGKRESAKEKSEASPCYL